MTRRLVDSSMWQNEKFATLPAMARLLQIGMINHADDQGRGKAHPSLLRAQVFPYDDVTLSDVSEWLRQIKENGTVLLYSAEGKDYYQMCNWWEYQAHQYAMPSDYPKPDGWHDRIRKTFTKGQIVTCNWVLSNGARSPDTCDEQGQPIQVNNQVNIQDKDYSYKTNTNVPVALAPLAAQFQSHLEELKTTSNKSAKLRAVYELCFGEAGAPDFGYLGKVAKQVGGAGRLAQLMFELVTRPPAGDVLAYIVAEETARKKRAKVMGENREISEVQFSTNGGDIYG